MVRLLFQALFACTLFLASAALAADVTSLPPIPPEDVEGLSVKSLEARVAKGDLKAQAELGARYGRGDGVTANLPKAIQLIEGAAGKGNPTAQYYLGLSYAAGAGVKQDLARAASWLEKAAKQDHPGAQFELGKIITVGQGGLTADPKAGADYILKSATQGYIPAAFLLGEMYQSGIGVDLSYELAAFWYRRILKTAHHNGATARLAVLIDTEKVKWQPGDPSAAPASNAKPSVNLK